MHQNRLDYGIAGPKSLMHGSGKEGGLGICMLNLQNKFPGTAAAAPGGDHTQRTLDVAVVTIQVLLLPSSKRGIVKEPSLLQFITTI